MNPQKSGSNISVHIVTCEIFLSETIDFIRNKLKKSETALVFMLSELKKCLFQRIIVTSTANCIAHDSKSNCFHVFLA